ncbi:MAG: DEAD/DEAH box helicase, partial [Candidatus Rokubacteria bacterium]|nr:DEAD/DEAH box helicase [Candidatus Rokubacteria bacterium]
MSSRLLTHPRFRLEAWTALGAARRALEAAPPRLSLEGLWGSAKALALAGLLPERPSLALARSAAEITRLAEDLRFFAAALRVAAPERVLAFPPAHAAFWRGGQHREEEAERAALLARLLRGEPCWVISSPEGLRARLPAPETFRARAFPLSTGMAIDREALAERLAAAGYERVEMVAEVGQWSVRGGIVDLFSPARPTPVRLELFGDEVESLRAFDVSTQRSTGALETVTVLPLLEAMDGGTTVLEYLPASAPVAFEDPSVLDPREGALDLAPLLAGRTRIELSLLTGGESAYGLDTRSVGGLRGQFRHLAAQIAAWRAEGFRVRLVAPEPQQVERLRRILQDHDLEAAPTEELLGPEPLALLQGGASAGFECPPLSLVVLTETELFGGRRRPVRRPAYQRGSGVTAFTDLAPGDLIVHAEHGIGRYAGLATLSVDGQEGDYLLLEYAEGDRLYLPVQRLGAIPKYVGTEGVPPRLDRLGGTSWQRVKESVRASLREMAQELLALYARRRVAEGHAVGPDAPWQHEFEAAFPFEETPDQAEAIREVKADMERPRPMDRLVCGDVGYGKTEVALRAAFKAVMDGKQAAVLAPTTILVQQHWETFKERFGPFPARVEMLSRFRTPREQKAVLEGLRTGTVDVVIGTHRLLSRDVAFKDLGLLVIDEEHRFGVGHKERLKQLRTSVDVLTLTATPIPRTLSMALSGIRDLSVIGTPPADRLAVETVVARFDPAVIKEAIERELDRGGQVFFVHNRVEDIDDWAERVRALVPEARIGVAHGQMGERPLERVMVDFVDGRFDVLVCTT